MGWWGGNIKADQIDASESATLQAATNSMLNVGIIYAFGKGTAITWSAVSKTNWFLGNTIYLDGHQGKYCKMRGEKYHGFELVFYVEMENLCGDREIGN